MADAAKIRRPPRTKIFSAAARLIFPAGGVGVDSFEFVPPFRDGLAERESSGAPIIAS
jgi:hypothetical protein